MKKLIIAGLIGFSSVVSATNWELIGENRNKEKAYLDKDSITDNNDYKAVWEKLVWKDGGYSLVHIVYYCPSRMRIYAEIVKYNKKDKFVSRLTAPPGTKWESVIPDTYSEWMFLQVCR